MKKRILAGLLFMASLSAAAEQHFWMTSHAANIEDLSKTNYGVTRVGVKRCGAGGGGVPDHREGEGCGRVGYHDVGYGGASVRGIAAGYGVVLQCVRFAGFYDSVG
jgi:hypothetical protein